MKGIIQLIGSLLGLTWDNIKARVTRKGVPDEAMAAVETSVPVAKSIASEARRARSRKSRRRSATSRPRSWKS